MFIVLLIRYPNQGKKAHNWPQRADTQASRVAIISQQIFPYGNSRSAGTSNIHINGLRADFKVGSLNKRDLLRVPYRWEEKYQKLQKI